MARAGCNSIQMPAIRQQRRRLISNNMTDFLLVEAEPRFTSSPLEKLTVSCVKTAIPNT
ncbi:hypothetical protein JOB18_011959 [Solea senegalensis]|uniref:Uncharacterized protein n=1 Tax=Solea senegalensis TaxID=28829 RepID=A0AAV6PER1_SOLSE|nr:hypothetical protein JOB18_011959 [Solea senegalensis]